VLPALPDYCSNPIPLSKRKSPFLSLEIVDEQQSLTAFNQLLELHLDNTDEHQVVPGISVTSSGQATVDPSLAEVLFDLAIQLEEPTNLPVDVEHVLAAIVLAARKRELDPNKFLSSDDPALVQVLVPHVKSVFEQFGGNVGRDD
jgi:hypothetical protein